MSGTIDKIKAKVDNVLHKDSSSTSDPTGPHDSRVANKADPHVNSDRVSPAGNTSGAGGYSTTGNLTGSTGYSDPTGPYDSRTANKLDPRVDPNQYGSAGNTSNAGGLTGSTGGYGTAGSDPTGPHNSRLANKADPRVDSDRVGSLGNTQGAGGIGGGQYTEGVSGHHGHHGAAGVVGSGNTHKTAGPHNSDFLNKADPRVDSDLDGSKTYGGNQTYQ